MPSDDGPLSAVWRRTPYLGLGLTALAALGVARDRRRWPVLVVAALFATAATLFWYILQLVMSFTSDD